MTRIEKAKLLAEHKLTLLETFPSVAEAKSAKKELTKYKNTFQAKAYKEGEKLRPLTETANRDFNYDHKDPLCSAVWSLHSLHPFAPSILKLPINIELLKTPYPALYESGLELYEVLRPEAEYLVALEAHINDEIARFKGSTAQQFLLSASKSSELTREKQEAFAKYSATLGEWKKTEIVNDKIIVNGKEYQEGDEVGVMIGRGCRVHRMAIYIGTHKDKETGEETEVIYIKNRTQWYYSDLVILDLIEDIPSELYSERI